MTRKRYIKLLMGQQGFSRDEAKLKALILIERKALADRNNHRLKSWGNKARRPQINYEDDYNAIVILGGKCQLNELRSALLWNSITKFSS